MTAFLLIALAWTFMSLAVAPVVGGFIAAGAARCPCGQRYEDCDQPILHGVRR